MSICKGNCFCAICMNCMYNFNQTIVPVWKLDFQNLPIYGTNHCALVESSGTPSVCMFTIHQNIQLLIAAAGFEENYHDFIKKLVCCPIIDTVCCVFAVNVPVKILSTIS